MRGCTLELQLTAVLPCPVPLTAPAHCAVFPACLEVRFEDTETDVMSEGSPAPMPLRLTGCGLPPPSSLISSDALRVPAAEGVKVTVIPQLFPAARVAPQVVLLEKSPALAPCKVISQMFTGRLPKLLSVTV